MEYSGQLVAIEGIDQAGKTTFAKSYSKIIANTVYCKCQGNPKTAIGQLARRRPCTFLFLLELLFLMKKIKTALKNGKIILCDRYYFSVMAHAKAQRWYNTLIAKLFRPFLIAPDKIIWIDVDADTAVERLRQSPANKFHVQLIRRPELIRDQQTRFQIMFCGKKVLYLNTNGAHISDSMKNDVIEYIMRR